MFTPFQSWQIAAAAILNAHLSQEVNDRFTTLQNSLDNLDATFSTDAERIAAVAAIMGELSTLSDSNASLNDAIVALTGTLKSSIGTKNDGTYNTATGANYISTATSVHGATVLLDTGLKSVANSLSNLVTSMQSNILGKDLRVEVATLEDWALRRFEVPTNVTAVVYAAVNGGVISPADVSLNGGTSFDLPTLPAGASGAPVVLAYF